MIRTVLALALTLAAQAAAGEGRVFIEVLGIAQDAGYPQAGCYRDDCQAAWRQPSLRRLVSSIAVVDEPAGAKYLFDATPDVGEQLWRLQASAPDGPFPLAGVFLTHGHIGHYTGLMHFGREAMGSRDVAVYAMPRMRAFLATNGPWDQLLELGNIRLAPLADGDTVDLSDTLRVTPFVVPHRDEYTETVGFRIDGPERSALFIPDIDKWRAWDRDIRALVRDVDYALLDATFYAHGELPGRDMSKIPHPLVTESMTLFADLDAQTRRRVIFIHMNHTNPLLRPDSDARREVERRGFRIASEGLQLEL